MGWNAVAHGAFGRPLGPSEAAFIGPWSMTGLGDMYLHLAFYAKNGPFDRKRVQQAWALVLLRHPLLLASVDVERKTFKITEAFNYLHVILSGILLRERLSSAPGAKQVREYSTRRTAGEWYNRQLDNRYTVLFTQGIHRAVTVCASGRMSAMRRTGLNGFQSARRPTSSVPSIVLTNNPELIDDALNGPRILTPSALARCEFAFNDADNRYDLLLRAPHFVGDGMSLHLTAHELLALTASEVDPDLEISEKLETARWDQELPASAESRLPPVTRLQSAADTVEFQVRREREIGGHILPRKESHGQPMKTILLEHEFHPGMTRRVLGRCKEHGVTINHAIIALVDAVWARQLKESDYPLPILTYTAISLRPYLLPSSSLSHWFLALTYYTLSLPSYPPPPTSFWARCQSSKSQTARVTSSPRFARRALAMSAHRSSPKPLVVQPSFYPSKALMGLSLIGNLDKVYESIEGVEYIEVDTASRQKPGGLLLLVHSFRGRLCLQLAYDSNGFEEGSIENFWKGLCEGVGDFILGG